MIDDFSHFDSLILKSVFKVQSLTFDFRFWFRSNHSNLLTQERKIKSAPPIDANPDISLVDLAHSMARANLKKSEELVKNTIAASK